MTNFELWQLYLTNNHAPKQYIEAAFYYMIGAALERRVWVSSGANKIYPNQYVLLVGPAGVGKGLVSNEVSRVLDYHRDPDNKENPLITAGPSAGSYQRLVERMAKAVKFIKTVENGKVHTYGYTSASLILDEFTSMFTEHAAEAVTFFCSAWAGNAPYDRDTNSRGRLYLVNPSLSLLAGTTPGNIRKLSKHDIVGAGLDRRLLIVFADRNERAQFEIPERSIDQANAVIPIHEHILKLSKCYGALTYSAEAREWHMIGGLIRSVAISITP